MVLDDCLNSPSGRAIEAQAPGSRRTVHLLEAFCFASEISDAWRSSNMAITPPPSGPRAMGNIEHVVLLMM